MGGFLERETTPSRDDIGLRRVGLIYFGRILHSAAAAEANDVSSSTEILTTVSHLKGLRNRTRRKPSQDIKIKGLCDRVIRSMATLLIRAVMASTQQLIRFPH